MRIVQLALSCVLIAMLSTAHAEDTMIAPPARTTAAAKTASSPRLPRKPQAAHLRIGEEGTKSTAYVEPKKSKQDIADEKKLQQDMHICDGC